MRARRDRVLLTLPRDRGRITHPLDREMLMADKICFVVQGFGEKTDFTTGRKLNLDASYEVIKEAVADAGLRCIRADEVVKTGTIDLPMYDWILKADLVIADLSTYNVNAAYELGVRYAVAPRATIIVAEAGLQNPFDFSHIVLHRYKHLGEDIGRAEAIRFKRHLSALIRDLMAGPAEADSPVYQLLDLEPPRRRPQADLAATGAPLPAATATEAAPAEASAKMLLDLAQQAIADSRFAAARELFAQVHLLRPADEYVIQQYVLAIYKSKTPTTLAALLEAREILDRKLNPQTTNNPETLGLCGAVEKRLWEERREPQHLDAAVGAYERGFYLKQDYYTGINFAFMLNVRAAEHQAAGRAGEAIADYVLARRVRREVSRYCEAALAAARRAEPRRADQEYWIVATLWEAAVGLEDDVTARRWQEEARGLATTPWMVDSTVSQLAKLQTLLAASPLKQLSST